MLPFRGRNLIQGVRLRQKNGIPSGRLKFIAKSCRGFFLVPHSLLVVLVVM